MNYQTENSVELLTIWSIEGQHRAEPKSLRKVLNTLYPICSKYSILEIYCRIGVFNMITQKEFEKLSETKTFREISREYGISIGNLSYWAKKWGIKSKYDKPRNSKLTQQQKDLIYGSLLGDGSLDKRENTIYFRESHGMAQTDYVNWKYEILKPITHQPPKPDGRGLIGFRTASHTWLNTMYDAFYRGGKRLPLDLEKTLNPFILAVWFMDDGCKNGKHKASLYSQSFTKAENEKIIDILQNVFQIESVLQRKEDKYGEYYYLRFNKKGFGTLTEIIKPFVIPSMEYKLMI